MKAGRQSILTVQRNLLKSIYSEGQLLWKVLILDSFNENINSSHFKIKDLRAANITICFKLKQERQQLHGVTAIYILQPTMENIEIIVKDFTLDLYSSVNIHFSAEPSTHVLSSLAKNLAKARPGSYSKINKVEYSGIGYLCLDHQLAIVPENSSLINIIVALKSMPVFVYNPKQQEQILHLRQRLAGSKFGEEVAKSSRDIQGVTMVLFMDRSIDYFPVFAHGTSYASMLETICKIDSSGSRILTGKQATEIDLNDEIWLQRKTLPINEMDLDKQFNKIKVMLTSVSHPERNGGEQRRSTMTKVDEHSELNQRHKKIQWHLHNAEMLIKQAMKRRLKEYQFLENSLYSKKALSKDMKKDMVSLLSDEAGNDHDKTRLMIVYLLCVQNIDLKEIEELEVCYSECKRNAFYNDLKLRRSKPESSDASSSKYLRKLAQNIYNYVANETKYAATKCVQKTRELREQDLKELGLAMSPMSQLSHDSYVSNVLVYVSGGVCFNEYSNLMQSDPKIIYTGDKFVSAHDFLN